MSASRQDLSAQQLARGALQQRHVVGDFAEQNDLPCRQAAGDEQGELGTGRRNGIQRRVVETTAVVALTVPLTVRLKLAVAVALLVSVTVTVNDVAVIVAVGVPVIEPLAALKLRPVGSTGDTL